MAHVTLITGPERRRRWGAEDRRQILMAAFAPGAVVADVSRQFAVSTSLIYKWRREVIDARAQGQFVPAVIVDDQQGDLERASAVEPSIVVELAGGVRVTIGRSAMAPMVSVVLRALR